MKSIVCGFVILLCMIKLNAQVDVPVKFSFCNYSGETVALKELKKCPELSTKKKGIIVQSFLFSIFVKTPVEQLDNIENAGKEGLFVEYKMEGNKLTQEVFDFLEKSKDEKLQVSIEDIKVSENGEKKRYDGFTFYLK